jgi:hypothetical protein
MMIWILALLLFGGLAYAGFMLGAIRAGITFIGLIVSSLVAKMAGHSLDSVLASMGVKNPVLLWSLGPFIIFLVVLIAFKVIGMVVHRKVDVYYKYKAGDLKMGLWLRLNARLGICLGVANAAAYLILISSVVYVASYVTTQTMVGSGVPWTVSLLNSAGKSLKGSGMASIAAAIDPMPETFYEATDLIGLLYHNDLLEARLSHYPAFLEMGERPEFQQIGSDTAFTELRQKQPPIMDILNNDKMQTIVGNPDLLKEIWGIVLANMQDLKAYLNTGKSQKYDSQQILGHWNFNLNGALGIFRRVKPNTSALEMQRIRRAMAAIFVKTAMVATPEKNIHIKDLGELHAVAAPPAAQGRGGPPGANVAKPSFTVDFQNHSGKWDGEGTKYQLTIDGLGKGSATLEAVVEGDKLVIMGYTFPMVFERE